VRAQFCVRCGTKLVRRKVEKRLREVCPKCGYISWRNPKPAVGVLVTRSGKLLLVRRERAPYKGYWDIPGGFVEAGEAPPKAAAREAREETGIRVKIDGIVGAYHDVYGGDHTFNVYFAAHAVGGREKAGDDATELRWFDAGSLPKRLAFPGHSRAAIRAWRKGRVA
jgi:ADP-ribose pyrophosphatase YjhB (NUDIX family)